MIHFDCPTHISHWILLYSWYPQHNANPSLQPSPSFTGKVISLHLNSQLFVPLSILLWDGKAHPTPTAPAQCLVLSRPAPRQMLIEWLMNLSKALCVLSSSSKRASLGGYLLGIFGFVYPFSYLLSLSVCFSVDLKKTLDTVTLLFDHQVSILAKSPLESNVSEGSTGFN